MHIRFAILLRAAWLAATLPILVASLPFSRLDPFYRILVSFAGRGKIIQSTSRFTVPQKLFTHFYVIATCYTSVLLLATWFYAHQFETLAYESTSYSNVASYLTGGSHIFSIHKTLSGSSGERSRVWRTVFLLLLMEMQALRRLYESIFVFHYSSSARVHIIGYLTGFFFYIAAPLSLCCDVAPDAFTHAANRIFESITKEKHQALEIEFNWQEYLLPLVRSGWTQWVGAMIFLWGSIHQYKCHSILGKLREGKEVGDEYIIPHGDWFEVVSSPHYLAEIVIYGGMVVASGGMDLTIWLLFCFVVANLAFAAAETQRWYHRKFEDYPKNRCALIPYVY